MSQVRAQPATRAEGRRSEATEAARSRWFPVAAYLPIGAVLFGIVALFSTKAVAWYTGPHALGGWVRYDAGWYRNIVEHGYSFSTKKQSSVAFFPVYPLAMRFLRDVFGGDPSAWGVLMTLCSGILAALLFHRWCRARMPGPTANTALLVLLLWPYGWYLFGAAYADALFVAMVLLAFTLVERDQPLLAALAGAVATGTRPVGVAVVVGLALRTLERRGALRIPALERVRWLAPAGGRAAAARPVAGSSAGRGRGWVALDLRRLRPLDPTVLLAAAGLVAYMVYLWHRFDHPFAFAEAESAPGWDQRPGPHTWFKLAWWSRLVHLPGSGLGYFTGITFQALLAAGLLLLVPFVVRRFGWAYGVYTVGVLAIPLVGSKDFMGVGRYALTAFPAFAALAEQLAARPRARVLWLAASAVVLAALCTAYARGHYVA